MYSLLGGPSLNGPSVGHVDVRQEGDEDEAGLKKVQFRI